jgi:hypothetical protein
MICCSAAKPGFQRCGHRYRPSNPPSSIEVPDVFFNRQGRSSFHQYVSFAVRLGSALEGAGKGIGKVVNSTDPRTASPRVGTLRAC